MSSGPSPVNGSSLQHLSVLLRREREVLEMLLGRASGVTSTLQWDELLRSVSSLELHRAITTREVALELGLCGEPTLRQLADCSPDGWSIVLSEHRLALLDLAAEVEAMAPVVAARAEPDGALRLVGSPRRRSVQRSLRDFLA